MWEISWLWHFFFHSIAIFQSASFNGHYILILIFWQCQTFAPSVAMYMQVLLYILLLYGVHHANKYSVKYLISSHLWCAAVALWENRMRLRVRYILCVCMCVNLILIMAVLLYCVIVYCVSGRRHLLHTHKHTGVT